MRFPRGRPDAQIRAAYEIEDQHRKPIVSDNGIGKNAVDAVEVDQRLRTAIIEALVRQLDARVDVARNFGGTKASDPLGHVTPRTPMRPEQSEWWLKAVAAGRLMFRT